jgi:hypothetical protein
MMAWGRTFSVQEQKEFFTNRASSKATKQLHME